MEGDSSVNIKKMNQTLSGGQGQKKPKLILTILDFIDVLKYSAFGIPLKFRFQNRASNLKKN